MDIVLAFGGFLVVLSACTLAARERPSPRPMRIPREIAPAGQPGFLRRLAS